MWTFKLSLILSSGSSEWKTRKENLTFYWCKCFNTGNYGKAQKYTWLVIFLIVSFIYFQRLSKSDLIIFTCTKSFLFIVPLFKSTNIKYSIKVIKISCFHSFTWCSCILLLQVFIRGFISQHLALLMQQLLLWCQLFWFNTEGLSKFFFITQIMFQWSPLNCRVENRGNLK